MITLTRGEAQNVLNLLILWLDEQEEPDTETAIETLRAKLSEPEPVAVCILKTLVGIDKKGLTDAEYEAMAEQYVTNCYFDTLKYAKAIEAKLRDKNS